MTYTANHPVDGDDIQTALSTYINQNITHIVAAISQEHAWDSANPANCVHNANLFKCYVGSATRSMVAATGTVNYTGIGFTPKLIIFLGGYNVGYTAGGYDGTSNMAVYYEGSAVTYSNDLSIVFAESSLLYQTASVSATASGQFTLSWTKSDDEPTAGNGVFIYICLGFQTA